MNKLTKIIIITLALIMAGGTIISAQQIDDAIRKISIKLKKDNSYLNLKYMKFQPDTILASELKDIPRTNNRDPYTFKSNRNTEYHIVFLNGGVGLDSIYLMYVDEITLNTLAGESFFVDESIKDDTTQVLNFKDLYSLRLNNSPYYKKLLGLIYNFVEENEGEPLPSLLGINPNDEVNTSMGMTSRDNTDYFNFEKINSPQYFPSNQKKIVSVRRSESNASNLRLDVSFSRIGFSVKALDYALGTTGFEVSTMEPILNLLPYESSTISAGVRTIFKLDSEKDVLKTTFLDVKIMGRINLKSKSMFESNPFIMGDSAKLNLSNALMGEFHITRVVGLPYLNLKFALGSADFDNPIFFTNQTAAGKDAYFSEVQYEFTMSFYWNTSDKMTSRFKLDIGIGGFDIQRANYDSSENLLGTSSSSSILTPTVQLYYNFVPANSPFLGGSLKLFHWRITAFAWVKLFEFAPDNVLRFETTVLTGPLSRDLNPWENNGGVMFQLRYRYGL